MATATKKCQVDITTTPHTIMVTEEPVASNVPQYYTVSHIEVITPMFFDYSTVENNGTGTQFKETYPYPTMTRVIIESTGHKKLDLELQDITNQATWSLGTKAALKTAVIALNALI